MTAAILIGSLVVFLPALALALAVAILGPRRPSYDSKVAVREHEGRRAQMPADAPSLYDQPLTPEEVSL